MHYRLQILVKCRLDVITCKYHQMQAVSNYKINTPLKIITLTYSLTYENN